MRLRIASGPFFRSFGQVAAGAIQGDPLGARITARGMYFPPALLNSDQITVLQAVSLEAEPSIVVFRPHLRDFTAAVDYILDTVPYSGAF
jgi:hypothetical protein